MVSCILCGTSCKKAMQVKVSFHQLPKDVGKRQQWLNFINKDHKQLPKRCFLCSQHFLDKDFDRSSKCVIRLKSTAVPSVTILRTRYSRSKYIEPVNSQWSMGCDKQAPMEEPASEHVQATVQEQPPILDHPLETQSEPARMSGRAHVKKNEGFPKDVARREAWVRFVGRGNWQPTKSSALCSKHFSPESFDKTSQCYVRIKPEAVPTLNKEESPIVYEVRVSSNGLIKSEDISCEPEVDPLAMTSSASPPHVKVEIEDEMDRCITPVDVPSPLPSPSLVNSDWTSMTPREQKLLEKLRRTEEVSANRKRKLVLLRRKFHRQSNRILKMKTIIDDLRKEPLWMQKAETLFHSKLKGPQEFLQQ